MKSFNQFTLSEGPFQPNGTDKVDYDKGMDGNGINPDKKNKRIKKNADITILNGEHEEPIKEETLDEGKMGELHADIDSHMSKHVANYKAKGGADHLGNKSVEVAHKIAKLHKISHEAAQKHVNDYVEHHLKEDVEIQEEYSVRATGPETWSIMKKGHPVAVSQHKTKEQAAAALKKLKEETMNEDHLVHVDDGSKYDEEPHKDDVAHVKAGLTKHNGKLDGHSDKGFYAKFNSHSDAENFRKHVNASPKRSMHADHIDESVQIDEISKDTLNSYVHKAFQHGNDLHYDIAHERDKSEKEKMKAKLSKRNAGVIKAAKKLREEEVMFKFNEFMNEEKEPWEVYDTKTRVVHSSHDTKRKAYNAMNKLNDKHHGYDSPGGLIQSKFGARAKGFKEEVEIVEEVEQIEEVTSPMQKLRDALDRHTEKAVAANKAGDHEAVKVHQGYMNKIKTKMGKLAKNEEIDLAELESLCELNKSTLASYAKKSHDQLMKHTATVNYKSGRRDDDAFSYEHDKDNMRKTANRTKGHTQAINKLAKEEVEELDECKVGDDHVNKTEKLRKAGAKEMSIKDKLLSIPRGFKAMRAGKSEDDRKLKEDNMLTYSEFMAQLSEGKIDDLKDKIAARKATQSAYDKDYKPAEKHSAVTKVKGHSYGAGEEDGDDDDDTKKVSKPSEPAVKRGRGRPAGSKSGARV